MTTLQCSDLFSELTDRQSSPKRYILKLSIFFYKNPMAKIWTQEIRYVRWWEIFKYEWVHRISDFTVVLRVYLIYCTPKDCGIQLWRWFTRLCRSLNISFIQLYVELNVLMEDHVKQITIFLTGTHVGADQGTVARTVRRVSTTPLPVPPPPVSTTLVRETPQLPTPPTSHPHSGVQPSWQVFIPGYGGKDCETSEYHFKIEGYWCGSKETDGYSGKDCEAGVVRYMGIVAGL